MRSIACWPVVGILCFHHVSLPIHIGVLGAGHFDRVCNRTHWSTANCVLSFCYAVLGDLWTIIFNSHTNKFLRVCTYKFSFFSTSFVWSWSFRTIAALLYQWTTANAQDMAKTRNIQSFFIVHYSDAKHTRHSILLSLLLLLRCRMHESNYRGYVAIISLKPRWRKIPCAKIHTHSTRINDIIVCLNDRINWCLFHSRAKWAKGVMRVT